MNNTMTTLKDLLRDFAKEISENTYILIQDKKAHVDSVEELVDEYTEIIKERIVG